MSRGTGMFTARAWEQYHYNHYLSLCTIKSYNSGFRSTYVGDKSSDPAC